MTFGFGFGFPRMQGVGAFSPAALFAAGEVGAWYDPSDLTTLYQDTAGTTPVTTPGQTVALMLDKSQGLVPGPELVTNGDFATGNLTGWTTHDVGTGAVTSVSGNALQLPRIDPSNIARAATSFSTVVGRSYRVSYDQVVAVSSNLLIGTSVTGGQIAGYFALIGANVGQITVQFVATTTTTYLLFAASVNGTTAQLDNISVRELPGNHATQATPGSRPTYAIEPMTGRRNLLTWTEALDNAAWVKTEVTVSANVATDPFGGLADKATPTGVSGGKSWTQAPGFTASGAWTLSRVVKADGYNFYAIALSNSAPNAAWFNLTTGAITSVGANVTATSATSLGNGWWRMSLTTTQTVSFIQEYVSNSASFAPMTGDGVSGILLGGAQWEAGSTVTPYQRVTTQFDVTEAGVASKSYLFFDGSDDFMLTGTITPSTDKAQVFAGVRKLSDVSGAVLVEYSADINANSGAFGAYPQGVGTSAGYVFGSRGTVLSGLNYAIATPFNSPITNIMTGLGDIFGDRSTLRVNANQVAQSTADQGTGNYLAYPLYIGRRGGTSLSFNGNIYGLITRFSAANLDAATITSTETWMNGKTGAY